MYEFDPMGNVWKFLENYWWAVLIGILIIIIITKYNKIINRHVDVNEAKGTIDVYLKQRFDLIPNLVEIVKGYAKYEEKVLVELTTIRSDFENKKDNIKEEASLYNELSKLIGVVEGYPNLKASDNYLNLQKQLIKVENEIQAARRIYNVAVADYNTYIAQFPNNIISTIFKFKEESFFNIDENQKENVEVNLEG